MRKPSRPILIFLLLIGIFAVIGLVMLKRYTADISPPDLSDMQISRSQIPPDQNGFDQVRMWEVDDNRQAMFRQAGLKFINKESHDQKIFKKVIDEFSEEIAHFNRLAKLDRWQAEVRLGPDAEFPELNTLRKLAMLKRIETNYLLNQGETELALQNSVMLMKLGQKILASEGSIIHVMVGMAFISLGHSGLLEIVDHVDLDLPSLNELSEQLGSIALEHENLANAYRYEFWNFKKIVDELADGKSAKENTGTKRFFSPLLKPFVFKPNQTNKIYADLIREIINQIPVVRNQASHGQLDRIRKLRGNSNEMVKTGNGTGIILVNQAMEALPDMPNSFAGMRAKHDLVRLRIAIEQYRITNKDWPASLETLVPEFIQKIPIDPMDGKPLRYKRDGLIIYCIGQDFVDNQGRSDEKRSLRDKNELVIRLTSSTK